MKIRSLILTLLAGLSTGISAQTLSNYQAVVQSQSPRSWFTFDGGVFAQYYITNNVAANQAAYLTVAGALGDPAAWLGGFSSDVFGNFTRAVFQTQGTDLLDLAPNSSSLVISGGGGPSTGSTASGSITFLFRTLNAGLNTGRRYVFSGGGDPGTNALGAIQHNALSLFFESTNVDNSDPNSLKLRFGDDTQTLLQYTNIMPNAWYYFALTYSESSVTSNKATWYLGRPGGTLASGVTSNAPDARAGDGVSLIIGSHTNFSNAFRNPGYGRVDEFATWNRRLGTNEILAQFATLPNLIPPPLAPYQAAISNQSPAYYFKLDGNFKDSVSGTVTLTPNVGSQGNGTTFAYDLFGNNSNCATFFLNSESCGLVSDANLLTGGGIPDGNLGTGQDAITCLFYTLGLTNLPGRKTIFNAGGIGLTRTSNQFELYFENDTSSTIPARNALRLKVGDQGPALIVSTNVPLEEWHYFAVNFDETKPNQQVTWWLGRPGKTLQSGNQNLAYSSRAGDGSRFRIGYSINDATGAANQAFRENDYYGRVDEVAIWHRLLTDEEVTNQFSKLAVTPSVPATPPTLGISASGGNVIISWPASTDAGYALESTTDVAVTNWLSAGAPVVVGTNYVVTNAIPPSARFYRLKK